MRLYEHETKRVFESLGINIPKQYGVVSSYEEFAALDVVYPVMVKSAVLIGGRGKAGGIKKAETSEEAKAALEAIIGLDIKGHLVEKCLIEEAAAEFSDKAQCYVGITIDPSTYMPVFIASASGGVEIEAVARDNPDAILKIPLLENSMELPKDVATSVVTFLAKDLKLSEQFKDKAKLETVKTRFEDIVFKLYSMFQKVDARLLEINPLLITSEGPLAVDAKLVQDDNAYFRQSDTLAIAGVSAKRHDVSETSNNERRAEKAGFPYVDLTTRSDENLKKKDPSKLYVGLVPGGAGYGIFSIDEVANVGERFFDGRVVPLNFMDSGGGPPINRVAEMFHLLMDDPMVDIIITSRFGGISSCDIFIQGCVKALRTRQEEKKRVVPIYGRMVGVDLPNARVFLEKARKETPEQLNMLHLVIGNQKIMAEVIRDGLREGFKYKGIEIEETKTDQVVEQINFDTLPPPTKLEKVSPDSGMMYHIVSKTRPVIAEYIKNTGRVECIVAGLGRQGTKHAGLMRDYGALVVGGIAAGRAGEYVSETIPVYNNVKEALSVNPNIAIASVWRHYTSARAATLELIEAGIPIVVLITEFIPLRDVRDILVAARRMNTLLIGGNSPGIIFPPERVKVGMLPDVFHPAETEKGKSSATGVTVISRSGAILYHVSDALASIGVSQNAVIGIGGDGANGTSFKDFVPLAMEFPGTDIIVMAGEIGGMQEELLAKEIKRMKAEGVAVKPILALVSGKHAPEGKTMGHAGAIVSPGQEFGTWAAKKKALTDAGVVVVNSQFDIIKEVKKMLNGKTYFNKEMYYSRMKARWDMQAPKPRWGTIITDVRPNNILLSGYPLQDLIPKLGLLEVAWLATRRELPSASEVDNLRSIFVEAAKLDAPNMYFDTAKEDVSKIIAKFLMVDEHILSYPQEGIFGPTFKTVFTLGRSVRFFARILGHENLLKDIPRDISVSELMFKAIGGSMKDGSERMARMLESMVVACIDHGVTPPSAQATLITSSARAAYEVSVAAGVSAITDVHGGAGAQAALFFHKVVAGTSAEVNLENSCRNLIKQYISANKRIEGLGHRVHTKDPRRDVLWKLADEAQVAKERVEVSKIVTGVFSEIRGMNLPVNVDGVIGAIVADMGLPHNIAKIIFIYGRIAGLSAHYFEEVASQPKMRRINFSDVVYKGIPERKVE